MCQHPEYERYLQKIRDDPGGTDPVQLDQLHGYYLQRAQTAFNDPEGKAIFEARAQALLTRFKEMEVIKLLTGENQ